MSRMAKQLADTILNDLAAKRNRMGQLSDSENLARTLATAVVELDDEVASQAKTIESLQDRIKALEEQINTP